MKLSVNSDMEKFSITNTSWRCLVNGAIEIRANRRAPIGLVFERVILIINNLVQELILIYFHREWTNFQ